ncbi:hypothetical protein [Curtobacterium flaccumfaciens]|uniref:hypothetical protein n=1 Tax=Curtobacterium flaccumfaciens TaxID=2035 RepID=UPI001BDE7459|nr:hypothetical protein [Curtobacterium flaccumfaciens]MBT1631477.1 hypothetical protein [Curtobacterium flaccumfaciens pv. oortii]MCX2846785.1 hypothetical protein [Curtobacterium flaccumfaciens pv. oortii]
MTMTLGRPTTVRPDVVQPETRTAVDELYAGDTVAAFRAIDAATADPTEHVHEWELTDEQRQVWEAGYMVGFQMAAPELIAEVLELRARIEQAEHDADRYYAEMCRRPAPAEPDRPTFAEISRARGEDDRAARHEATMDRMFPQYANA